METATAAVTQAATSRLVSSPLLSSGPSHSDADPSKLKMVQACSASVQPIQIQIKDGPRRHARTPPRTDPRSCILWRFPFGFGRTTAPMHGFPPLHSPHQQRPPHFPAPGPVVVARVKRYGRAPAIPSVPPPLLPLRQRLRPCLDKKFYKSTNIKYR